MTIILSILALISAIITIYAKTRENILLQYIFKPLTMSAIIFLAVLNFFSPPAFYQKMTFVGLIFSTVGDIFLIDSNRRFLQGLTSFLLAHICFIIAFYSTPNLPSLIFYLAYFLFFLSILWKFLGNLKIPVVIYSIALTLMSWFAMGRYFELNDYKSLFAFLGSVSFIASDSLLAFKKFKLPFRFAEVLILSTYFFAQWLIALSI